MNTMKAVVFHGVNDIRVERVARPRPEAGEAVIRITVTTICGTDVISSRASIPFDRASFLVTSLSA
jgi:alcohol dehydrogenase